MSELLPCPFCGGEAEWCTGAKGDGSPWTYLACADCEAMGPYVLSTSDDYADAATHVELWNRRASQAEIERLRTAIQEARDYVWPMELTDRVTTVLRILDAALSGSKEQ